VMSLTSVCNVSPLLALIELATRHRHVPVFGSCETSIGCVHLPPGGRGAAESHAFWAVCARGRCLVKAQAAGLATHTLARVLLWCAGCLGETGCAARTFAAFRRGGTALARAREHAGTSPA
jgi:hypothetical protein